MPNIQSKTAAADTSDQLSRTRQGDRPERAVGLPQLLDISAVANALGVEVRHVRRLVAERRIPFVKWGHLLRFDPAEVAAWINGNRRGDYEFRPDAPQRRG